jgi:hypothetical protein
MAKKLILVLLVLIISAGAVFAQKNAVALDMFPLFKGFIASDIDEKTLLFCMPLGYEYLIAPHFTIGGDLDMYFGKAGGSGGFYMGLAAAGRYYPMSQGLDKFFLGASFGFNMLLIEGKTDYGFVGLFTSLKAGYKLTFSNNFFIEPSMAYVLSKMGYVSVTPLGWQGGLRVGLMF